MKTQQKGFTLIELIIVIVVLGILAVTAAPQFFNFSSDARASTVKGMEGSVKAASALVYAKALLNPSETVEVQIDQFDTNKVNLTPGTQYAAAIDPNATEPEPDPLGIIAALDMSDFEAVVATTGVGEVKIGDLLIYPADLSVDGTAKPACYVVYRAATTTAAPVIFSVTNGC